MRDTHGWRRALLGAALLTCLAAVACAVELGTTARTPGFLEVEWDGATTDTIDALIAGVVIAQDNVYPLKLCVWLHMGEGRNAHVRSRGNICMFLHFGMIGN